MRDLNVKGAVLSFLVAKGFNDLQVPHQAMTMTRVAAACARDAEHPGLIALTDGLKSLIAYWAERPEDAHHYARQGAETAAQLRGTVGLWLLGLQARAAAAMGDEATVRDLNQRAADRRDRVMSARRVRRALVAGRAQDAVAARNLRAEIEAFPASRPALPRG
ncbi:hypothetical protein [Streptomyces ziwulingensis]|uniref:Uncharacterized protein n=1 Tax=Streptomyces ziwulingensis TaxID=1045501 RepID=A0ABP9AZU9_9ACTN